MRRSVVADDHVAAWFVARPSEDCAIKLAESKRLGIEPPRWEHEERRSVEDPFGRARWTGGYVGPGSWFPGEVDQGGVESFLYFHRHTADNTDVVTWLLAHGVAPGQPFYMRVPRPTYTCDYWGEHDVEYGDAEVLEVAPWTAERVVAAWCREFGCDLGVKKASCYVEVLVARGYPFALSDEDARARWRT